MKAKYGNGVVIGLSKKGNVLIRYTSGMLKSREARIPKTFLEVIRKGA